MRLFVASSQWSEQPIRLAGDEARYATKVLRVAVGDRVDLLDGEGRIGAGLVRSVTARDLEVDLEEVREVPHPTPRICLAQALPKGKKMDLIIEKCTELGVSRIIPLQTRHAVARADGARGDRKVQRWRELARSATRQSGQAWVPVVEGVRELEGFLDIDGVGNRLLCSLAPDARRLRDVLAEVDGSSADPLLCLVGPEGDFSEEERDTCLAAGAIPVSLGASVLRTETAALFVVGAIRYQFG